MNLSDMVQRVCDDANTNSSISTVSARVTREINRVCEEVWNGFRWSFRWRNYRIVTDTDVTSGTVTLTNGSRVVSGSGTAFLSSHVTWHISFLQDSVPNWYKVRLFTSSTQIELDVPYQGTGGSNKTYVLRHFDYVLPTEPWDFGSVTVTHDKVIIPILEPFSLDVLSPVPYYKGYPMAVSIYGSDSVPTVYSTGTVSGTINTQILTGSGTSWLSNIYPGDTVTIGTNSYSVRSVDTDTQITLYQSQQVASSASTYTITRQFGRIMRIMWPSTDNYTLDLRALRMYQPLVNNNDTNELFYRCPNAISLKVAAMELRSQPDSRSEELEKNANVALQMARAEDDSLTVRDSNATLFSYRYDRRMFYRESIR